MQSHFFDANFVSERYPQNVGYHLSHRLPGIETFRCIWHCHPTNASFSMVLQPTPSSEELPRFHRVVTNSVEVRSHFDVLVWLQGEMRRYLPQDIISALDGVRSPSSNRYAITPLQVDLFMRWTEFDCKPFAFQAGDTGFVLKDTGQQSALGDALQEMHCAMVHGIKDERGSYDCLYVAFSTREYFNEPEREMMATVLPYIDAALRQVVHLPRQLQAQVSAPAALVDDHFQRHRLSSREVEVLQWVASGKTNAEIGNIRKISGFTVKNHMRRIFKKLDVSYRAQTVGKLQTGGFNV